MNIKKAFLKAITLLLFLSILYYFFYALNENKLSHYCDNYICLEILSLAEFLGIITAWISLYFVLKSLESWKDAYKFHRTIETLSKFEELKIISNQYHTILYQLKNSLIRAKGYELHSSFDLEEQKYEDKFNNLYYYDKLINLQQWLNQEKNVNKHKDFKEVLRTFETAIDSAHRLVSEAHLSEVNYGQNYATETDVNRRKESIKKVQIAFEKYSKDKTIFEKRLEVLRRKLEL